jgi:hypothetical protein
VLVVALNTQATSISTAEDREMAAVVSASLQEIQKPPWVEIAFW